MTNKCTSITKLCTVYTENQIHSAFGLNSLKHFLSSALILLKKIFYSLFSIPLTHSSSIMKRKQTGKLKIGKKNCTK